MRGYQGALVGRLLARPHGEFMHLPKTHTSLSRARMFEINKSLKPEDLEGLGLPVGISGSRLDIHLSGGR